MALLYLETSALVKRYIRESGTDQILELVRDPAHQFAILSVTQVEFRSAIRRRERTGDLPSRIGDHVIDLFGMHLQTDYIVQPVGSETIEIAGAMVDRHVLHGYDALQLAGYLALKIFGGADQTTFVCSDRVLLQAAVNEGGDVFDPAI